MTQSIKASHTIGENIRTIRKTTGMTQDTLTTQLQLLGCDLSRGGYAKIEAGIRHVSLDELRCIKLVLKTSYDELLK